PKELSHNVADRFNTGKSLHLFGPFDQLSHITEDCIIHALHIEPVAGVYLIIPQLFDFEETGAIGVVIPEPAGKCFEIPIKKRRLEDVSQQNIPGNRMIAEEVHKIALGMSGAGEP